MQWKWGGLAAIGAAVVVMGGCATNQPLLLSNGTTPAVYTADAFLPGVNTVDSGELTLTAGQFNGGDNALVFTEPFSTSQLKIAKDAVFTSGQQIYDTDGDGKMDYIVLTLRALSAQAAHSVDALDQNGSPVINSTFYKVAGIAILPADATITPAAELTLPINPAGLPATGRTYSLFKWDGAYQGPDGPSAQTLGVWRFVPTATPIAPDSTGNTVTFTVSQFGEYCVATSAITPPA